jgi:hypothetical protein
MLIRHVLAELLQRRASQQALARLSSASAASRDGGTVASLAPAYTAAGRLLGHAVLSLDDDERSRLDATGAGLIVGRWTTADLGRAWLLVEALRDASPDRRRDALLACFEQGDSSEQQSWLRAVSLYGDEDAVLRVAVDACRTNILPQFESIACENPYPAARFPELHFNQMVLKALFNGVALQRIVGLESRLNPDLSRMADDYVSEREAAVRTVPPDIWCVVVPFGTAEARARAGRYAVHEQADHRHWAARSLAMHPAQA